MLTNIQVFVEGCLDINEIPDHCDWTDVERINIFFAWEWRPIPEEPPLVGPESWPTPQVLAMRGRYEGYLRGEYDEKERMIEELIEGAQMLDTILEMRGIHMTLAERNRLWVLEKGKRKR